MSAGLETGEMPRLELTLEFVQDSLMRTALLMCVGTAAVAAIDGTGQFADARRQRRRRRNVTFYVGRLERERLVVFAVDRRGVRVVYETPHVPTSWSAASQAVAAALADAAPRHLACPDARRTLARYLSNVEEKTFVLPRGDGIDETLTQSPT
jgi:hypothetical protein